MKQITVSLAILLLLAGCSPIVRAHGNSVDDTNLSQIQAGVAREADVLALLGTPSAEGTFNPNQWYYISVVTKKTAFFAPEVAERSVVRVTFDPTTGLVSNVKRLTKEDGQNVALVERTTPTEGHNLNAAEQILSNIGRFNTNAGKAE